MMATKEQDERAILSALIENLPQKIFFKDRNSKYLRCNARFAKDLKISPRQIAGMDDFAFFPAALARRYRADDRKVMTTDKPLQRIEKYAKEGRAEWVHTIKVPWKKGGRTAGILGIFWDVTRPLQSESEFRDVLKTRARATKGFAAVPDVREDKFEALVRVLGEIVYERFVRRDLILWEGNIEGRLGYGAGEMGNDENSWLSRIHPDDVKAVLKEFESASREVRRFNLEYRFLHKNGTYLWILDQGFLRFDRRGDLEAVVGVMKDISARKADEVMLREYSLKDELTGLFNRRGLMLFLDQHMKKAKRDKKNGVLLYCDVDNLKTVNDRSGHTAGDFLLRNFAGVLRRTFRDSDILARIAGDEFVVFPVDANPRKAGAIKDRLLAGLAEWNRSNRPKHSLSVSAGATTFRYDISLSGEELIARADKRMYVDKRMKSKFKEVR